MRRFLLGCFGVALATGIGTYLLTATRSPPCVRYPCDPQIRLPYFWIGFVLLLVAGVSALSFLARLILTRARTRGPEVHAPH